MGIYEHPVLTYIINRYGSNQVFKTKSIALAFNLKTDDMQSIIDWLVKTKKIEEYHIRKTYKTYKLNPEGAINYPLAWLMVHFSAYDYGWISKEDFKRKYTIIQKELKKFKAMNIKQDDFSLIVDLINNEIQTCLEMGNPEPKLVKMVYKHISELYKRVDPYFLYDAENPGYYLIKEAFNATS